MKTYTFDETALQSMFEAHRKLPQDSEAYFDSRNQIMRYILSVVGEELKNFPNIWRSAVHIDRADAESLIYQGLLKAIDKYTPERGKCKFSSFLWTIVGQQFKRYEKYWEAGKRHQVKSVPLVAPSWLDTDEWTSDDGLTFLLFDKDKESFQRSQKLLDAKIQLEQVLETATPLQRELATRVLSGEDFQSIAQSLGIQAKEITKQLRRLGRGR